MKITRVDATTFNSMFQKWDVPIYNSTDFTELNRAKADSIHYLIIGDGKIRFGIVLGGRNGKLLSPFSAPFGGFVTTTDQSIALTDEAVQLLIGYLRELNMEAEIALPPSLYAPEMLPKQMSALLRHGELMFADLNYHYELCPDASVESRMQRNARKNYRKALAQGFKIEILDRNSTADIARAYAVIQANRQHKGYPLRMPLADVIATAPIVDAEFMVMSLNGQDVAAAQLHRVTPEVMQVVYWGDAPGFEHLRPMNLLAPEVFRHCRSLGASIVDIGPSSENGIPSPGLCAFKESVGCTPSLKPRFRLK